MHSFLAQVIRHETYSFNCDIYSFAILAWEMLTYHVPFPALTPVQAAFGVAFHAQRPPLPANCSGLLGQLIQVRQGV